MGIISVLIFFKVSTLVNIQADNLLQIIFTWFFLFSLVFTFLYFAYYDLLYWEVDFRSVIIALIYFIIINVLSIFLPLPFIGGFVDNLIGGVFLAGLIFAVFKLSKGGGMGEGDIYLFALSGLILGMLGGLIALVITSMSGSVVGLIAAGINKKNIRGMKIQLAPYIAFGTLVTFFFKDYLINWILNI
jgi:prepilin signal peptidase PulO-like enzyme (type II secretory pathway)